MNIMYVFQLFLKYFLAIHKDYIRRKSQQCSRQVSLHTHNENEEKHDSYIMKSYLLKL
jgi:hypothetical protein